MKQQHSYDEKTPRKRLIKPDFTTHISKYIQLIGLSSHSHVELLTVAQLLRGRVRRGDPEQ